MGLLQVMIIVSDCVLVFEESSSVDYIWVVWDSCPYCVIPGVNIT